MGITPVTKINWNTTECLVRSNTDITERDLLDQSQFGLLSDIDYRCKADMLRTTHNLLCGRRDEQSIVFQL